MTPLSQFMLKLRKRLKVGAGAAWASSGCARDADYAGLMFETLEQRLMMSGTPMISEFMGENVSSLQDGDGRYSDWIELYNDSAQTVDLAGWYLTDDEQNLTKWELPTMKLKPNASRVVFASGQPIDDYTDYANQLHTNFTIDAADDYLGLVNPAGEVVWEYDLASIEMRPDVSYGVEGVDGQNIFMEYSESFEGVTGESSSLTFDETGAFIRTDESVLNTVIRPIGGNFGSAKIANGMLSVRELAGATEGADENRSAVALEVNDVPENIGGGNIFWGFDLGALTLNQWQPGSVSEEDLKSTRIMFDYKLREGAKFKLLAFPENGQRITRAELGIITGTGKYTTYTQTFNTAERLSFFTGFINGIGLTNSIKLVVEAINDESYQDGDTLELDNVEVTYDPVEIEYLVTFSNNQGSSLIRTLDVTSTPTDFTTGSFVNPIQLFHGNGTNSAQFILSENNADGQDANGGTGMLSLTVGDPPNTTGFWGFNIQNFFVSQWTPGEVTLEDLENTALTFQYDMSEGMQFRVAAVMDNGQATTLGVITGTDEFEVFSNRFSNGTDIDAFIEALNEEETNSFRIEFLNHGSYSPGQSINLDDIQIGRATDTTYRSGHREDFDDARGGTIRLDVAGNGSGTTTQIGDLKNAMNVFANSGTSNAELLLEEDNIDGNGFHSSDGYLRFEVVDSPGSAGNWGFYYAGITVEPWLPEEITIEDLAETTVSVAYWLTDGVEYDLNLAPSLGGLSTSARLGPIVGTGEWEVLNIRLSDAGNINQFLATLQIFDINTLRLEVQNRGDDYDDGDTLLIDNVYISVDTLNNEVRAEQQGYLQVSTPGSINGRVVDDFVETPDVNITSGFYDVPFEVTVVPDAAPNTITRYTLDGSTPTFTQGDFLTGPIMVTESSILRIASYREDAAPSISSYTYLFDDDLLTQDGSGQPATWGVYPAAGNGFVVGESVSGDYEVDEATTSDPDYAPTLFSDIHSIPTLHLTLKEEDLFDSVGGIYANPIDSSAEWVRDAQVELFNTDGELQLVRAVEIQISGGESRVPNNTLKHDFELSFGRVLDGREWRDLLFEDSVIQQFETLTLRAGFEDGLASGNAEGTYVKNAWLNETFREMGHVAPQQDFAQLYLNGLYWGIYGVEEKANAAFAASYFGGRAEDYDVIRNDAIAGGDDVEWHQLLGLVESPGFTLDQVDALLDTTALIDLMILNQYAGNSAWAEENWVAVRNDDTNGVFHVIPVGSEAILNDVNAGSLNENAQSTLAMMIAALETNETFKIRYQDRFDALTGVGGALSAEASTERFDELALEIEKAIVGESARWGDGSSVMIGSSVTPEDWTENIEAVKSEYFAQRLPILTEQLRNAGVLRYVDAPEIDVNMDNAPVSVVTLTETGTPRVEVMQNVIDRDTPWRAYIPKTNAVDADWVTNGFDDTGWLVGTGGIGYDLEEDGDFVGLIDTNIIDPQLPAEMNLDANQDGVMETNSIYLRYTFTLDGDITGEDIGQVLLRMRYDDGFGVYLNGELVMTQNAPNSLGFSSSAIDIHEDELAVNFETFNLSNASNLLQPGENVLSVHAMNNSTSSSDMLMEAQLDIGVVETTTSTRIYYTLDGSDPRGAGGSVAFSALSYSSAFPLFEPTVVNARMIAQGVWSPLLREHVTPHPPADTASLVITELHYNPADATFDERMVDSRFKAEDMEFVELKNVSDVPIDLGGLAFTQGIVFDFDMTDKRTLAAGEVILVVANQEAFEARYGDGLNAQIVGEFDYGHLKDGNGKVQLVSENGVISTFEYDSENGWPSDADGLGASLERVAIEAGQPESWTASDEIHGTPGVSGFTYTPVNIRGDFNNDELVTSEDITLLQQAIGNGSTDLLFDLNDDSQVNKDDLDELVNNILNTNYGDADLDRIVNLSDLAKLATSFGLSGKTWAEGDFTGDGTVDLSDLAVLATHFGKDQSGGGEGASNSGLNDVTVGGGNSHEGALLIGGDGADADAKQESWSHIVDILGEIAGD